MCAGAKKRPTLYKANISSTQAENYFSALLAHSPLAKAQDIDRGNTYCTTEKGMQFIECYGKIRSLIGLVIDSHRIDAISVFYAFDRRP